MTRLLLSLLLLLSSVAPTDAAIQWFMGIETGDLSEGLAAGGTPGNATANSSIVKTGAYSMNTGGDSGRYTTTTGSPTTIFARMDFRWDNEGVGNQRIVVPGNGDGSQRIEICLRTSDKIVIFTLTDNCASAIAAGTTVLATGTFYLIEVKAVVSATVGGAEVKVNGNTEFSSFGTNTSAIVNFATVAFGSTRAAVTASFYYDNMMVCDTSYCPHGGTVARQGLSGTPTYNAWTKAGTCSGGNISTCWSATPFSTAASATSAVAADAQTMLVSPFNATQTGHGTETIKVHDTINACKTAGIIKSGTSSAPLSLRRRINGADTDTAKTLTTSDAYYDDGIWTTSADYLSNASPEIGVLHGSGSATDTVEDMWLICDYLAVTVPIPHRVIQ